MKKRIYGYIIKVSFAGDATTPVYDFKLYRPRKWWFPKLIWIERIHRRDIRNVDDSCHWVIDQYEQDKMRWGGDALV